LLDAIIAYATAQTYFWRRTLFDSEDSCRIAFLVQGENAASLMPFIIAAGSDL